jgi:hypothetical protein
MFCSAGILLALAAGFAVYLCYCSSQKEKCKKKTNIELLD